MISFFYIDSILNYSVMKYIRGTAGKGGGCIGA